MPELMDIVRGRRSIRKYEDKEVSDQDLNKVLEAVQWAPSWANTQVWEVVVVKNQEIKDKLQETLSPKNPATRAVTNAPVVLGVCGKLKSAGYYSGAATTELDDWFMFDLGLATQNICLTAHDLGLGTVIVGAFDQGKAGEILNVPEGYQLVALVPLGYPAKVSPAPKRREISEFTHYDTF